MGNQYFEQVIITSHSVCLLFLDLTLSNHLDNLIKVTSAHLSLRFTSCYSVSFERSLIQGQFSLGEWESGWFCIGKDGGGWGWGVMSPRARKTNRHVWSVQGSTTMKSIILITPLKLTNLLPTGGWKYIHYIKIVIIRCHLWKWGTVGIGVLVWYN